MGSERWAAVCASGGRLGLGTIVLAGDSPSAVHVDLDADHVVVEASPEDLARGLLGVHCFVLRADETADVFATFTSEPGAMRRGLPDPRDDEAAKQARGVVAEDTLWDPHEADAADEPLSTLPLFPTRKLTLFPTLRCESALTGLRDSFYSMAAPFARRRVVSSSFS